MVVYQLTQTTSRRHFHSKVAHSTVAASDVCFVYCLEELTVTAGEYTTLNNRYLV